MFNYLIVCPLVFIAGFIDAIAGGGGLISLPAYLLTGMPVTNCLGTNKMTSSMGTTISTIKYAKSGFIPWKIALFCIPCAFAGSGIGSNIALRINDNVFKIIMLIILPLTGAYVLTKKELTPKGGELSYVKTVILSMIVALVIGVYDGFYGPGTGTFLILLLTGLARLPLAKANGLTKTINLSTNIAALTVFLINGQVIFPLGIIAGLCNVAGNYLGASRFEKGGSKWTRPVMIVVLSVFFIKVLMEILHVNVF